MFNRFRRIPHRFLCILLSLCAAGAVQNSAEKPAAPNQAETATSVTSISNPKEQAWHVLRTGTEDKHVNERVSALLALTLLRGNSRAARMAIQATHDDRPEVRAAAVLTLGELHTKSALPVLRAALSDKDIRVVMNAAHELLQYKDPAAYNIYYSVLTGERKGGQGLIASQMDILRDPKKAAELGLEEGIGYVPFAGIGYAAFRVLRGGGAGARVAAADALAEDPDPASENALLEAAQNDKNLPVRIASLRALARRGNAAVIDKIAALMSDDKSVLRYSAAAAVLHLSDLKERKASPRKPRPQ
jgi:HEAT repeat protein